MKKKFILFAFAAFIALMSLVFAGCNNSAPAGGGGSAAPAGGGSSASPAAPAGASGDAYDLYIAAAKAMNDAENISMDITSQTKTTFSGQTTDITTSGPVQVTRTGGKLEMQMVEKSMANGLSTQMTVYYKDGYMYLDMGENGKLKMEEPEDQLLNQRNIGAQVFDKQYVKDAKSEKTADGTKLTFTVDGKGMNALMSSASSNLGSDASAAAAGATVTFGDATIIAVIDGGGAMKSEDVTMSFSMNASGQDISADVHSTVENIKIGGANITFPGDLDAYQALSAPSQ